MAGKTEWEDALIKHGIMQAPERIATDEEKEMAVREALETIDPHAALTLDQLDECEDDMDEDDLNYYRQKRLEELKQQSARNRFGALYHVGQTDYKVAVTEASHASPVVVHLMENGSEGCTLLNQCFAEVARRFPHIKFVKVIAQEAIEKFPRENCPTVLVYVQGQVAAQFVKMAAWAGMKTTADVVEWVLSRAVSGMMQSHLDEDPRSALLKTNIKFASRAAAAAESDDDADW